MTKVLFCHGAPDRLQAAAAWLWQTAGGGATSAVIYAPDGRIAERLDQLLWVSPPTGFLPHCRARSPLAAETPILIAETTAEVDSVAQDELLLNLGNELPPGFGRFANLVEIISQEDSVRLPGRERAKFYRDRGYDIQYRDLQKDPL